MGLVTTSLWQSSQVLELSLHEMTDRSDAAVSPSSDDSELVEHVVVPKPGHGLELNAFSATIPNAIQDVGYDNAM